MKEKKCKLLEGNNPYIALIIVLLIIIAVMGFFLGKFYNSTSTSVNTGVETANYEELTVTVIGDSRDNSGVKDSVLEQLKLLPSVGTSTIVEKDFSDEGIPDYLNENNVTALPLIVFSTNSFDVSKDPAQMDANGQVTPKVNSYLQIMPNGEYYLEIGAQFNPFETRSERGFLLLDKEILSEIKSDSYVDGNSEATITWLEYSDLECPYCAKLHNAGTVEELQEKYGDDLNIIFNHFPLGFHANAQIGAEILECIAEQNGSEDFFSLMRQAFKDEKSDKSYLIDESVALGADKDELESCLDKGEYKEKIQKQMNRGTETFGVTGTPGNVLINNTTGEYEVISGAYPTSAFIDVIDKLK